MELKNLYTGFDTQFLLSENISDIVMLPEIGAELKKNCFNKNSEIAITDYLHYSLMTSSIRKFPIFTASNINGQLFKKAKRRKSWKKDSRIKKHQWGSELYSANMSDFDKGHMTKREDVQWGTFTIAQAAANSTFYYSNAVPQHKDLNQRIWRKLENYILHKETNAKELKICVFTGPVLSESDPQFVTEVKGAKIQLPILFWKVVIFPKDDGKIYRVGFIMSQKDLLEKNGIIIEEELEIGTEDGLFNEFSNAGTYQVNVSLIEELTGLKFQRAIESYSDDRNTELVLNEIQIESDLEGYISNQCLEYSIDNLVL